MRIAFFSAKPYDRRFFDAANEEYDHEIDYLEPGLSQETARLAEGHEAVCAFVNDSLGRAVLEALDGMGVRLAALRSTGFNNVDLDAARELGICVCRVPAYSPQGVAQHAVALMLTLNRKIHRAHNRIREGNFSLEGLLGFDMNGKTAGVVGTGRIGTETAKILHGFGCRILAFDPRPNETVRGLGDYVERERLFAESAIVTLHCPLTPETRHMIGRDALARMRDGVMLVNTSRGKLVDTRAAIEALKSGKIGALGLDVYEEEGDLFFEDLSDEVIRDDVFARLLTFPNVIVTGHQAFFTEEALASIAATTLGNVAAYESEGACRNSVLLEEVKAG